MIFISHDVIEEMRPGASGKLEPTRAIFRSSTVPFITFDNYKAGFDIRMLKNQSPELPGDIFCPITRNVRHFFPTLLKRFAGVVHSSAR